MACGPLQRLKAAEIAKTASESSGQADESREAQHSRCYEVVCRELAQVKNILSKSVVSRWANKGVRRTLFSDETRDETARAHESVCQVCAKCGARVEDVM